MWPNNAHKHNVTFELKTSGFEIGVMGSGSVTSTVYLGLIPNDLSQKIHYDITVLRQQLSIKSCSVFIYTITDLAI